MYFVNVFKSVQVRAEHLAADLAILFGLQQ
jgi:hypothetical protein